MSNFPLGPFRRVHIGGGGALLPGPGNFSNLELYLDSRLGLSGFADGANVNLWPDQSGHSPARDAIPTVGGGGPTLDPTMGRTGANLTPAGAASVVWKGNRDDQALAGRTQFNWPQPSLRGYTLYFYGLTEQKTIGPYSFVNQTVFGLDPTNFHLQHTVNTGGAPQSYGFIDDAGGGNPHRFGTSASVQGKWALHTVVLPPPNNNTVPGLYYLNGVLIAQTAGPANYQASDTGVSSYGIGNNLGLNVALRGNIGWYAVYSEAHAASRIALLTLWTKVFFGLT
jgi:hypothetical protein